MQRKLTIILYLLTITTCLQASVSDSISDHLVSVQIGNENAESLPVIDAMNVDYHIYKKSNEKEKVVIEIPDHPNSKRFWTSNAILGSACIASIGILYAMPEDVTNWNREEITMQYLGRNWSEHVKNGPVVDRDNWILNYIMHPYFGSVYYMALRGAGYEWWQSGVYSVVMSTFFWEYGFEAIAETPSIQDLIITPVLGSGLGEVLFQAKKKIKKNNDYVLGSGALGRSCLFLIDPLNEVQDWFKIGKIKKYDQRLSVSSRWSLQNSGLAFSVNMNF